MLIACPSCRRQLQVPDDGACGQVQCPACRHVFAAEASASEQIQEAPAPRPHAASSSPMRDDDDLPRRTRYDDSGDNDVLGPGAGDDLIRDDDGAARRRARAAAVWFFLAAGVTLLLTAADIVKSFTVGEFADLPLAGPERSIALAFIAAAVIGCGGIMVVLNVLIIVAGRKLQSFGAKGWVITGIVLAFVQALLFAGSALIEVVTVMISPDEAMAKWMPLSILLDCISGTMNTIAGIQGIIALNNPAVSNEFERQRYLRRRGLREG